MVQVVQSLLAFILWLQRHTIASSTRYSDRQDLVCIDQVDEDASILLDPSSFLSACRVGNLRSINRLMESCCHHTLYFQELDNGFLDAAGQGHWNVVLALLRFHQLRPSIENNRVFVTALGIENVAALKSLLLHPKFEMDTKDLIVRTGQSHSAKVLEGILESGRIDVHHPDYFYILLAVLECDHASIARTALFNPQILITTETNPDKSTQIVEHLQNTMPSVQNIFLSHPGINIFVFQEIDRCWNNDSTIINACRLGDIQFVKDSLPILKAKVDLLDLCLRVAIDNRDIGLFWALEPAIYSIRKSFVHYLPAEFPHLNAIIPAWANSQIFAAIPSLALLKDIQRSVIGLLWLICSYFPRKTDDLDM